MLTEEFEQRIIGMQDTHWRVACTLLSQPCDREDAISECILKALKKRESLRDDRYMKTWLIRILINECYAILRRNRRVIPSEDVPAFTPAKDADPEVFHALFALEEKFRLPMVLYYVEGYSTKEISKILHLPAGTVSTRLSRGRRKIKAEMEASDNAQ